MALIPGVSRSGGTITAGLFLGYSRSAAARYSFLLAVPAVLGLGVLPGLRGADRGRRRPGRLLGADDPGHGHRASASASPSSPGCCATSTAGSFTPFVVYRVVLGVLVLALVQTGVLDPT